MQLGATATWGSAVSRIMMPGLLASHPVKQPPTLKSQQKKWQRCSQSMLRNNPRGHPRAADTPCTMHLQHPQTS
jgi:hypothetical protein